MKTIFPITPREENESFEALRGMCVSPDLALRVAAAVLLEANLDGRYREEYIRIGREWDEQRKEVQRRD